MAAPASAGHHLAAAEKEAGVGGGVGGVAQSRSCRANGGKSQRKIRFTEASDSGLKAPEGLTSFRGIVCVISFFKFVPLQSDR